MNSIPDLKARLDELGQKIAETQHRLQLKAVMDHDHAKTAEELVERHNLLAAELRKEVSDFEAHGRHVGALEKSVLDWINSLSF